MPGMICSANAGPNLNKSQFYITLSICQQLDGKSTIFGKLLPSSLNVLEKFNSIKTDKQGFPSAECKLIKATILDSLDSKEELKDETVTSSDEDSLDKNSSANEFKSFFIS